MNIDLDADDDLPAFTFTFTAAVDFTAGQQDQLVQWYRKKASFCLLVRELHDDGRPHYHSVIAARSPKNTGTWTRACTTLYKQMDIENVKGISFRVKKETDRVGWFHYLMKDQGSSPPLLLMGWKMSWIKQKMLEGIKKIPRKLLTKDVTVLTKATAAQSVLKYAAAMGRKITGKISFCDVCCAMEHDKYIFGGYQLKHIYREVLNQSGQRSLAHTNMMAELHFVE